MKRGVESKAAVWCYTASFMSFVLAFYLLGAGLWEHDILGGVGCFILLSASCLVLGWFAIGLGEVGREEDLKREQKRCTDIANTLPIYWGWMGETDDPKPWGCIITADEEAGPDHYGNWYCDQCPAQNECPYPNKKWSE